jgi:hypothetical protein
MSFLKLSPQCTHAPTLNLDSIFTPFMRPASFRYVPPLAIYWRLALAYFVDSSSSNIVSLLFSSLFL